MKFLKEAVSYILTFSVIFLISFVIVNFSAVQAMFSYYVTGKTSSVALNQSLGNIPKDENLLLSKGSKKLVKKEFPPLELTVAPLDFRLLIPKIGKDVPLVLMDDKFISDDLWGKFEREVQDALRGGVVHYPGTALPGQNGTAFFTGHSSYYPWDKGLYKDVFANLVQLNVGDDYFVYYQQKKYHYRIIDKKEVRPTELGVLHQPKDKKLSALMTCWPLGTTLKRLVVIAEEIPS